MNESSERMSLITSAVACASGSPLTSTGLQPGVATSNGQEAVSTASPGNGQVAEAAGRSCSTSDTRLKPDANKNEADWLLWQLADSAFPTGGYAHSAGLEAAWQHGEIRDAAELRQWLVASLDQLTGTALPFVNAACADPQRLADLDQLFDAFTSNHVANRASRLQGKALLGTVERVFHGSMELGHFQPGHAHFGPVFGAVARALGLTHSHAIRLFVFMHLRSVIAAAVRLNIVGPMEGQAIQFQLSSHAEAVAQRGATLGLDHLAQTAPLFDLWQGAHDRLYSRLFQT